MQTHPKSVLKTAKAVKITNSDKGSKAVKVY